jgi:hypothetical protein
MDGKRYVNATQAAGYLGMARRTFYRRGMDERLTPHYFTEAGSHKPRKYYAVDELDRYK